MFGDERWGGWERDAFHVLGFDVMFDDHLNASLLEVLNLFFFFITLKPRVECYKSL